MRPVTIEMQGFGVFRDRTVVDLADAELFAIVGRTGDGKSTIIDAICFALYGKVARYDKGDLAPVISLGAAEVKVSFKFALGSARYVATRIGRRNTRGPGAKSRAVRLEQVNDNGTNTVLAGSVGELDEWIRGHLGLDFDQFVKCVVLPQGQFAAFLHARTGERAAILGALLDLGRYDRMAGAARERAGAAGATLQTLQAERAALDVASGTLADARVRLAELATLRTDLDQAVPDDLQLADSIRAAEADATRARAAVSALANVRIAEAIAPVASRLTSARSTAADATARAEATEVLASERDTAIATMPAVEQLHAARDAYAERDTLLERIANGAEIVGERAEKAAAAKDALVGAQQILADAEHRHDAAVRAHAHSELRSTLVAGDPCPVCEQPVAKVPRAARTTPLTKAHAALDAARKALQRAEGDAQQALSALHQAEAQLDALRERDDALDAKITGFADRGALADAIEARERAQREADAARAGASSARAEAKAAIAEVTDIERALHDSEALFQQQRDAVVSAGLVPPTFVPTLDLVQRWEQLAQFAADVRPEQEKLESETADLMRAFAAERDALLGDVSVRARELGAAPAASTLADVLEAVVATSRDAEHEVARLENVEARTAVIDVDIRAAQHSERVAAMLGRLLDKGHFGQWLVDAALRGLLDGASVLLRQLSGGQYSLVAAADGELLVVDHANADETRSVRSLSGGETFQASLALALALADQIAEMAAVQAAPLESIFLDEGFGTLDPESLDIVAGTIESLVRHDRVVGVVTHVPELAERMPVRLRVRKVGRTATVTREQL